MATDVQVVSTRSWTLPAILVAQFVIPMSITGTAIALPPISDDLGTAAGPLQWVVNGFNVPFALGAVLWGAAADRIGYRTTFRAGVGLALLGGLLSAASNSLLMLDLSRVMAGLGSAAVLTSATSLLSSLYAGPAATGRSACSARPSAWAWRSDRPSRACWPADSAGARSSWRTARCWWWRR
jgi:MFS family permease